MSRCLDSWASIAERTATLARDSGGLRPGLYLVYRLDRSSAARARRAARAGFAVACLSATSDGVERVGGAPIVLGEAALADFELGSEVEGALDLTEAVYADLAPRSPAPKRLASMLGSEDARLYFQRSLLRDVAHFFGLTLLAAEQPLADYGEIHVDRTWPGGHAHAAVLAVATRHPELPLPDAVRAAIERLRLRVGRDRPMLDRLSGLAYAITEVGRLWLRASRHVLPRSALPRRPLLIRTYGTDWGLDLGGRRLRNVDFLVDGTLVQPAHVVFWAERDVPAGRREQLAQRGYAVIGLEDVAFPIGRAAADTIRPLLAATVIGLRGALGQRLWHRPAMDLVYQLVLWRAVIRRTGARAHVAYNNLDPTGIARNLALRRLGCTSVEYEFSSHWRSRPDGWVPDYVYAFGFVDRIATWGPAHTTHLRRHRGSLGGVWEVGCLWSEHARVIEEDESLRSFYAHELKRLLGRSLTDFRGSVAVFDTTPSSTFSPVDIAAFYEGVLAAASGASNILFVLKPKNPLAEALGPSAADHVLAAADSLPNVVLLPNLFETAAVVGLTDATVNACFTSTLVEGFGAGRLGVYFDPNDRVPEAFWRRYPNLVFVDRIALRERVEAMVGMTRDERLAELHSHYRELEGHFDGRAVTRLREHLRAELVKGV